MLTVVAACYLGERAPVGFWRIFHLLLGTGLVAGGTAALNQVWERRADGLMRRTMMRPLPQNRLTPLAASAFGIGIVSAGLTELFFEVNVLTAGLGLATTIAYLFAYTPLKSRSPLSTVVGAFPGAGPVLMGWAAGRGVLDAGAWVLFAVQFLWQFPHFLSIAWLYREDYARAGINMLPVIDKEGSETGTQIVLYSLALVPISILPSYAGIAGNTFAIGALLLSVALLYFAVVAARAKTRQSARCLLQATVYYLPLLFGLMMLDKR
jgi:protoheme IX farnesyltransferase